MALIWWLLCMYFSVVIATLSLEVYHYRDVILSSGTQTPMDGNPGGKTYVLCEVSAHSFKENTIYVPTNMIPMWALSSLVGLMLIYVCVLVVNVVPLRTCKMPDKASVINACTATISLDCLY